jgi:hypothetical protein
MKFKATNLQISLLNETAWFSVSQKTPKEIATLFPADVQYEYAPEGKRDGYIEMTLKQAMNCADYAKIRAEAHLSGGDIDASTRNEASSLLRLAASLKKQIEKAEGNQ